MNPIDAWRSAGGPIAARCAVIALLAIVTAPSAARSTSGAGEPTGNGASLPSGWSSHYVDEPVFHERLFVVEAGDPANPPVLLVHGLGQSASHDWWSTIATLQDDYHVIAPDLPGFGHSGDPGTAALSPANYARLLHWLIDHKGIAPVHLVGHSMGGTIALFLASEWPSDVRDLVVADVPGVLHRAAFVRTLIHPEIDLSALPNDIRLHAERMLDAGERVVERLATGPDITAYLRRENGGWNRLLSGRPNTNAALSLVETSFAGRLQDLDRPVTIVWGSDDSIAPIRTGHLLEGRLPDAVLQVIDGSGHVPMRDRPAAFQRILRHALATPLRRSGHTRPDTPGTRDLRCQDEAGRTFSGRYDRIVLDGCVNVRLRDVAAQRVDIVNSLVRMTHVRIIRQRSGPALRVRESAVQATDVTLDGDPALQVDGSRLDLAGVSLHAPGAAIRVGRDSRFIFSVSDVRSDVYRGCLHGMARAARRDLEGLSALHPTDGHCPH